MENNHKKQECLKCSSDYSFKVNLGLQRKLSSQETRQKEYQFNQHPSLANWWFGEIEDKDLEMLINNFCHLISLSHQNGDDFKKAHYFYKPHE